MNNPWNKYSKQIDKGLSKIAESFLLLEKRSDKYTYIGYCSPRWINIRDTYEHEGTFFVFLRSTQTNIGFHIEVDEVFMLNVKGNCSDYWAHFREYRTKFLQENFPTIETY